MDEREVVSGNRDPLVEFADTMAEWYRCFLRAQTKPTGPSPECPVDSSPYWIVHVLDCIEPLPGAGRLKGAGIKPLTPDEYRGKSIVMVTDAAGLALGFEVLPRDWYICDADSRTSSKIIYMIFKLLQRCTEAPMCGGMSRRPARLQTTDRILQKLVNVFIQRRTLVDSDWSFPLAAWDRLNQKINQQWAQGFSLHLPPVYYCNACKRKSFPSRLKECSQCRAVYYCQDRCSPPVEHRLWCDRLAQYMHHEAKLADVPFSYTQDVTSKDFSLEDFLSRHKLDRGYWVYWSMLLRSQSQIIPAEVLRQNNDWIQSHSGGYGPLKNEAAILMSTSNSKLNLKKPLVSWREYFVWRGLSLSSVVAPLLSSALSIYYIITALVPKHFPDTDFLKKQSLRIHIIESYRELHTLATLWELTTLLPHETFDLVFINEHLPAWCNMTLYMYKTDKEEGNFTITTEPPQNSDRIVRVKVHRGKYLTLLDRKPDLIIGFKPNFIRQNPLWYSTLRRLQWQRVPAYFCEISEFRCESSEELVSTVTGGTVSPPTVNPFRCPLRINRGDNKLPKYSNAFIFHLIYKPLVKAEPVMPPVLSLRCRSISKGYRIRKVAAQRRRQQHLRGQKNK